MTSSETSFRVLSLCAVRPGERAAGDRLRAALAGVREWDVLVRDAERHGMEPLLLAHVKDHGVELPPAVETRLKVRYMQQAHAASIRARVLGEVLDALAGDGIPALVVKGAALAHLVYPSPPLRPMRDVDLLVPRRDADRAWQCLRRCGFEPLGRDPGPGHHHLHTLAIVSSGRTISVEIHRQLLETAPFVPALGYDDLSARAQAFALEGRPARTLAPEDMLWHVYAHGFLVSVLRPAPRLISIADLTAALEVWRDAIDWDRLRAAYPRLARALPRLGEIATARRPAGWWFDMRYGVDGVPRRIWNQLVTHPATLALGAVYAARAKLRAQTHAS